MGNTFYSFVYLFVCMFQCLYAVIYFSCTAVSVNKWACTRAGWEDGNCSCLSRWLMSCEKNTKLRLFFSQDPPHYQNCQMESLSFLTVASQENFSWYYGCSAIVHYYWSEALYLQIVLFIFFRITHSNSLGQTQK